MYQMNAFSQTAWAATTSGGAGLLLGEGPLPGL